MTVTTVEPRLVADVMVCALASEIADRDVLGVGLGTPLAVLAGLLARRAHAPRAHMLVAGAVDPDADFETVLGGPAAMAGCTAGYIPHLETMGMAESQAMTVQILRPAQVDRAGNLNTSHIGPAHRPLVRFPGGLATADVPSVLPRLVAYLPEHSLRTLPDRVACVTGAGGGRRGAPFSRGLVTVVTEMAVLRSRDRGFELASVHPWRTAEEVARETGFDVMVTGQIETTPLPTESEAGTLAALDPRGLRSAELRSKGRRRNS